YLQHQEDREQIFITNMSIRYSDDVSTASFIDTGTQWRRKGAVAGGASGGMGPMGPGGMRPMGPGGMGPMGPGRGRTISPRTGSNRKRGKRSSKPKVQPKIVETGAGFVVSVSGYSPNDDIAELFDPLGVGDNEQQWGVVTKLRHLDKFAADGNSPFKLYDTSTAGNYKLETGEVAWNAQMPTGIGIVKERKGLRNKRGRRNEEILLDPMTKEVISKKPVLNERGVAVKDKKGNPVYEINDHWFNLNFKLLWKDAPKKPEEATEKSTRKRAKRKPRTKR
ncbi:hypothetical protein ACFL3G_12870, partial [Planctomycetota bacterium]